MRFNIKKNIVEQLVIILICCGLYLISEGENNALRYNLFRVVTTVCMFCLCLFRKQFKISDDTKWKGIFVIYTGFSLIWSGIPRFDCVKTVFFVLILYALVSCYCTDKVKIENFIRGFMVAGLVASLLTFMELFSLRLAVRMALNGINENIWGLQLFFSAVMFIYFAISKNRKVYYIGGLLCLFCSMLSGSKKVILNLTIVGIVYVLYYQKSYKKILYLFFYGIVLIFLLYFIMNNQLLHDIVGERMASFIGSIIGNQNFNASDTLRYNLIIDGWQIFLDNTLLGVGLSNYELISKYLLYTHCNYLELLCNLGIIGFLCYYCVYMRYIYFLLKKRRNCSSLQLLAVIILFLCLVDDIAMVSYTTIFIQILLALTFAIIRNECMSKIKDNTLIINIGI